MPERLDIEGLIDAHQRDVWRYLRMLGCDASQADDLAQETFVAVMQRSPEHRGRKAMSAYLRTTARNLYIDTLRRETRKLPFGSVEEAEAAWTDATPDANSDDRLDALERCLDKLDERSREAVDMRYRDKSDGNSIARALGVSENAVYSLLKRARVALRKCVEESMA